jgi:hypothetical protein
VQVQVFIGCFTTDETPHLSYIFGVNIACNASMSISITSSATIAVICASKLLQKSHRIRLMKNHLLS